MLLQREGGFSVSKNRDNHDNQRADHHLFTAQAERFVRMLEPVKPNLMAFCNRSIPVPSDRDDVLQTALTLAFAEFHVFQEGTNFRAWLFAHLRHAVWNHCRKYSERPEELDLYMGNLIAPDDFGTLSHEVEYHELLQQPEILYDHFDARIAQALLALSFKERTALLLRSIGNFNYRDIARIMNIPMGTVMSHLSRAREKMRERIASSASRPEPISESQWHSVRQGDPP